MEFGRRKGEIGILTEETFPLPPSEFEKIGPGDFRPARIFLQVFACQRIPVRYKLVVLDEPDNVSQFTVTMAVEFDPAGHA